MGLLRKSDIALNVVSESVTDARTLDIGIKIHHVYDSVIQFIRKNLCDRSEWLQGVCGNNIKELFQHGEASGIATHMEETFIYSSLVAEIEQLYGVSVLHTTILFDPKKYKSLNICYQGVKYSVTRISS